MKTDKHNTQPEPLASSEKERTKRELEERRQGGQGPPDALEQKAKRQRVSEIAVVDEKEEAQPISQRDWEDEDQIPLAELPKFSDEQIRNMTRKEIEEQFEKAPLKFIHIDHPNCVLDEEGKMLLKRMLLRKLKVFSLNDNDPGTARHEGVKIQLKPGEETPVCHPTRPTAPHKRALIRKHIENMLKYNIIEPSKSPWGANVLLVPKATPNDWRFVVDMRGVNAKTVSMSYPLVRIQDALDALAGNTVFSVVDNNQSFFQLPMIDRELTAFRCFMGSFHFKKMPMGLKNSGPIYQEWMDRCLGNLKWQCALVYIDDCIIFSKSIEQHFADLEKVLNVFEENDIHLKAKKSAFFRSSISFLGHVIDKDGVRPDPKKVECIVKAKPITKKQIQSWVSMAGYYRRHVPNFAKKVQPLYDLIKSKSRISSKGLSKEQQEAIDLVKKWLTTSPILAHPQWEKPFTVCTDASTEAIAAVLEQRDEEGRPVAVMYISRALRKHEKGYHIYELEILAMVWAISVFEHYLYKPFVVVTDNKAMTWLRTKRDCPNRRIMQWVLNLEQYNFEIKHRSSKQNANADGPTRFNAMGADANYGEKVDLTCSLVELEPSEDETCDSFIQPEFVFTIDDTENEALFDIISPVKEGGYHIPDRDEMIKAQSQDRALQDIIEAISMKRVKEDCPFFMKEGMLMRKTPNPHKFKKKLSRKFKFYEQIVVPDNDDIKEAIFFLNHDHIMSAHGGFARIIEKVEEKYYWKSMKKDLKKYTKLCLKCVKRKTPRPLRHGLTQSMEARYVMHKFAFDIVTSLPETTARGYTCILTGIDMFSRYPFAVPMANRTMKSVVHALRKIFTVFGFPKILISDREPSFVSQVVKQLMKKMGTRKSNTTGYQPQGNSPCERFNGWLSAALTMYCNENKTDWDEYIDCVLYAYRTCVQTSTGFTPFELMFGRRHRDFSDFLYQTTREDIEAEKKYFIHDTETMRNVYKQVRENQARMMKANKEYRDKNRIDVKFETGDFVLIWDPKTTSGGTKKLQFRWSGPAQIVRRSNTSPLLYIVNPNPTLPIEPSKLRKLHVNRLHLYHPFDENFNPPTEIEAENRAEELKKMGALKGLPEIGEYVIVGYQQRPQDKLPFALVEVISVDKGTNTFTGWWMGNNNENIFAAQRKGYWQPSTNKHYYADKPIHPSHPRYTSVTTETYLSPSDILMRNVELGFELNIPFDVLFALSQEPRIGWKIEKAKQGMEDILKHVR